MKESTTTLTEAEVINVFELKPEKGTVVATLTPEDASKLEEAILDRDTLEAVPHCFTQESARKILAHSRATWIAICKSYNVPYAWTLCYDLETRNLYTGE